MGEKETTLFLYIQKGICTCQVRLWCYGLIALGIISLIDALRPCSFLLVSKLILGIIYRFIIFVIFIFLSYSFINLINLRQFNSGYSSLEVCYSYFRFQVGFQCSKAFLLRILYLGRCYTSKTRKSDWFFPVSCTVYSW